MKGEATDWYGRSVPCRKMLDSDIKFDTLLMQDIDTTL